MTTSVANDASCCMPGGGCSCCCCKKCCCTMPHGKATLVPLITLTIAATLSMLTLANCYFVRVDYTYSYFDDWDNTTYTSTIATGAGFWPYCVYMYGRSDMETSFQDDAARKVAMSFGLIACIVGVGVMAALWPITCQTYSRKWIRILCSVVAFAFVSQLVTFSMFGTELCQEAVACTLDFGGALSIVAAVLYLLSFLFVWKIAEPIETSAGIGDDAHALNETKLPDGTVVTEKTTI